MASFVLDSDCPVVVVFLVINVPHRPGRGHVNIFLKIDGLVLFFSRHRLAVLPLENQSRSKLIPQKRTTWPDDLLTLKLIFVCLTAIENKGVDDADERVSF